MFRRSQALLNQIFSTTSSSKSPSKISSIGAKSFSTKTRGLGAKIAGSQKVPEAMVSRSEASGDAKTKNTAEGFEEERIRMLRERITRVNAKGGLRYIEKGEEDYVLRGGAGEAKTALPHDPHVPIVPGERYSFHRKDAVSGEVLVKLPANLTFEEFTRDFKWFMPWYDRLQHNLTLQDEPDHGFHAAPYHCSQITVQSYNRWGPRKIGFAHISAVVENANDEALAGTIFMRGPAVGMLVVLIVNDAESGGEDEKYVVVTRQARVPAGSLMCEELCAGMVDDGTFQGAASKEIKEELDIEIPETELINLDHEVDRIEAKIAKKQAEIAERKGEASKATESKDDEKSRRARAQAALRARESMPEGMFPSVGGSDEYLQYFMHEKQVTREYLEAMRGKLTGLRAEGEKIVLVIYPLDKLFDVGRRDAKAMAAYGYVQRLEKLRGQLDRLQRQLG